MFLQYSFCWSDFWRGSQTRWKLSICRKKKVAALWYIKILFWQLKPEVILFIPPNLTAAARGKLQCPNRASQQLQCVNQHVVYHAFILWSNFPNDACCVCTCVCQCVALMCSLTHLSQLCQAPHLQHPMQMIISTLLTYYNESTTTLKIWFTDPGLNEWI